LLTVFRSFMNVANSVLWRMAIISKTNKVNLFESSVLFVFWYHSPNVLDTPHMYKNCHLLFHKICRPICTFWKNSEFGSFFVFWHQSTHIGRSLCPLMETGMCWRSASCGDVIGIYGWGLKTFRNKSMSDCRNSGSLIYLELGSVSWFLVTCLLSPIFYLPVKDAHFLFFLLISYMYSIHLISFFVVSTILSVLV
jgi:hypothetical protein